MLIKFLNKLLRNPTRASTIDEARMHIAKGDYQGAQECIERLSARHPQRIAFQQCLLAEIEFHQGRDAQAELMYKNVLLSEPAFAEAHYGLSLVFAEANQLDSALEHAIFAKSLMPEEARYLGQLAYCYMRMDGYPAAEGLLRMALRFNPKDKHIWNNLAIMMRVKGQPAEAKAAWLQALEIDPDFAKARENMRMLDEEIEQAHFDVKVIRRDELTDGEEYTPPEGSRMPWREIHRLLKLDQWDAALNLAEEHLPETPSTVEVIEQAHLYNKAADPQAATELLVAYLNRHSEDGKVWRALGELCLSRDFFALSIDSLRKAIECGESNARVHASLGAALHGRKRYNEGLSQFQIAYTLDPTVSNRKNLAAALIMCCRYDEALEVYETLLQTGEASEAEIRGNLAVCYSYLGRFSEAEEVLNQIIEHEVHDPAFRMMRAIVHLLHGRWKSGWLDYVWRGVGSASTMRILPFAKWRGEPLAGKSLVILAEQGLGDQIMFASCLPDLLRENPARVVFEVNERVATTLQRSFPACEVVPTRQKKDLEWVSDLGAMDYFVPLANLPMYCRNQDADFPGTAYLQADPLRVAYWTAELEKSGPRPWIGFSWKGGTEITRTAIRTTTIEQFQPLAARHGGTWVCLQYGKVDEDVARANLGGFPVAYWAEAIADLDEFAALVAALDAVVTVCNTTVHFAGSLGVPTIVVAPHIPEWRYGVNFSKLPWYPDVRVLRQPVPNQWDEVFALASDVLACTRLGD